MVTTAIRPEQRQYGKDTPVMGSRLGQVELGEVVPDVRLDGSPTETPSIADAWLECPSGGRDDDTRSLSPAEGRE